MRWIPLILMLAAYPALFWWLYKTDPVRQTVAAIKARGPSYRVELWKNTATGEVRATVWHYMQLVTDNPLAGMGKAICIDPQGAAPYKRA